MGWEEQEREGGKGGEGWLPKLVTSDAVRKTQNNSDARVDAYSHPCDGVGPSWADPAASPRASCLAILKSPECCLWQHGLRWSPRLCSSWWEGGGDKTGDAALFKGLIQTLYTSVPLTFY